MSQSRTSIFPLVGLTIPKIDLIVVVFPEPLGPMKPVIYPVGTFSSFIFSEKSL